MRRFTLVPLAAVAVGLVVGAAPAGATHIGGATYQGSFTAGGTTGTVKFTVSSDGESVEGFDATAPTEFPGQSRGPFTCTLEGEALLFPTAIDDHAFEFTQPDGSFFRGTFAGRQTASGTMDIVVGGGACRSGPLSWSARTSATPPSPPRLLSVRVVNGRASIRWSLGPGQRAGVVEVANRKATGSDGSFPVRATVDFAELRAGQRSFRSDALGPGTYYVHVSSCPVADEDCLGDAVLWSKVRRLVVRRR